MTSRLDTAEHLWSKLMSGDQPSQEKNVPGFRPVQTPHERKADDRTRLVREITDAATDQRVANVARLRQARLNKEAEDKSQAAPAAPTKKRGGGPAG
jgi:hypothetical protein